MSFKDPWVMLDLPDPSPFDILSQPRAIPKPQAQPKKRGPKPRDCVAKTLAALSKPDHFNVPIMSRKKSDRTGAIRGAAC